MIELKNVVKKYEDKIVIQDFSYCFENNGFYFIVGKSGSGKTTLLNLIGQLESPTSGSIEGNNDVSYVFQDANLFYDLTVLENVLLTGANIDEVLEILDLLSISNMKDKKVNVLSGGERQRVSIARAFATNSSAILLDEPTGNLDDENSKQILEFLKEKSKEKLIIMVTHDIECSVKYGDVILSFENEKIIEKKINNIDKNNNKLSNENKKSLMSFKYQFLYSIRLLSTRLSKYFVSLILCILSLTLLFFVSSISFNNVDDVVENGISNDIRNYYSIDKKYYNATTDENISYSYGEIIEEDLKTMDIEKINYYKTVRINNALQNFNLIIESSNYEGIVITDFVSKYFYGDEDSLGKSLDVGFNGVSNRFIIQNVEKTDYESVYDLFLYDEKYMSNNIDDFKFHYGYIKMSINSYMKYYENGIVVPAANFTLNNISCSEYVKSFYNLDYFFNEELSQNDVYVSRDFYDKYMKNVQLPFNYSYINIRDSINAAKYYDYLNVYDIFENVNVIGIIDSSENDVYISNEKYEQLLSKQLKYTVDGICISDGFNVNTFHNSGFRLCDSDYKKVYSLCDLFDNQVKIIINILALIVIAISFFSLYFSVVGFMDKKAKEIFIMKSMKISKRKIINIFLLYILYVILIGMIFSFIFGGLGVNLVNKYLMNELLKINIEPFVINFNTYLASIGLSVFTSLIILIGPLYKLKKIDSAILIKENL